MQGYWNNTGGGNLILPPATTEINEGLFNTIYWNGDGNPVYALSSTPTESEFIVTIPFYGDLWASWQTINYGTIQRGEFAPNAGIFCRCIMRARDGWTVNFDVINNWRVEVEYELQKPITGGVTTNKQNTKYIGAKGAAVWRTLNGLYNAYSDATISSGLIPFTATGNTLETTPLIYNPYIQVLSGLTGRSIGFSTAPVFRFETYYESTSQISHWGVGWYQYTEVYMYAY